MIDFDLPVNENLIMHDALSQQVAYNITLRMFSKNEKPDAIFAVSDYAALGALMALQEMNIKVPAEVGIVGFANEPFTSIVNPALSTVDQMSEDMGRTAAHMLLEQVSAEDENVFVSQKQIIKPQLIIRKSSKRI
jgi:LacI family transcriptional regulator